MYHAALRCVIYVFASIIPQILFLTHALAESVHDKVHPSLVFLKATALGSATGVEQASVATGVIVSENGLVLTVFHFLAELGNYEPTTLQMRASISKKEDQPSLRVALIDANPPLDLLLLKINVENQRTPKIALGGTLSRSDEEQIYSSGFLEGQGYLTGEGKITAREGPAGNLYATNIHFGYGQSGSPVYDKDARLIGIAKGSFTKSSNMDYFIPIEFADALLSQIVIRDITNALTKINEKISGNLDPTLLDTRIKEIEAAIINLRERLDGLDTRQRPQ
jgi:S1-C subfamily serine protease